MDNRRWSMLDADGNVLNVSGGEVQLEIVGQEFNGVVIASVRQEADEVSAPEEVDDSKRFERKTMFEATLDKVGPVWYNSLTTTQQTNLATWRQAWLDYPNNGVYPDFTLVEDIF